MPMTSLRESLDAIRRAAEGDGTKPGRISADDLTIMHRVTAEQRSSGFQARMPKPGQPAPPFMLADQDGTTVSSNELVSRGPLVISFFRGRW